MNREEYLQCRKSNSFPIEVSYRFYKDNGGDLQMNRFEKLFRSFMFFGGGYNNMMEYYDNLFEVHFLYQGDKLIKIY